jgi:hypothetical protein
LQVIPNRKNEDIRALKRALADRELAVALLANGVAPYFVKGASALLRGDVQIEINGSECTATILGNDIASYLKSWVAGPEGRKFCMDSAAPNNDPANPFSAQSWNKTKQGLLIKADRSKAVRYAVAAGFTSLEEANKAFKPRPAT